MFGDRYHEVKINFPIAPDPSFFVEVDGQRIQGVCGVLIESGLWPGNLSRASRVTIRFYAKKVEGDVVARVQNEEVGGIWKRLDEATPEAPQKEGEKCP